MKKILIFVLCLVLLSGCSDSSTSGSSDPDSADPANGNHASIETPQGDVIEIREKLFVAQTNDIYLNSEDYLGKTIKYEGIFDAYHDDETDITYYSVVRYGPGCCGYDSNAGFEVIWDKEYPEISEWVEVIGVLEEYDEFGEKYLRLQISSIRVLETRGQLYVTE